MMFPKEASAATLAHGAHHRSFLRAYGAPADQNNMHRLMNVADALFICQVAPGQRRLRVSHLPERSVALNIAVSCGVASFFLLYFGLLLVFFTVSAHVWGFRGGIHKPEHKMHISRFHVVYRCSMPFSESAAQESTGNLQPQWRHMSLGFCLQRCHEHISPWCWTASLWSCAMSWHACVCF